MSKIEQEILNNNQPIPIPIEGIKTILYQIENYICKIYKHKSEKGTGFFCNIPYLDKTLPFLVTNNHVLNEKDIENNKIIKLALNNNKEIEIIMDNRRKRYTNIKLDITFIEIRPDKDNIKHFMELDKEVINKDSENDILDLEYKNKSIYIFHYPKGELSVSYGLIDNLNEGKIINLCCNTEETLSGSPILSLETYKIIGIHYGGNNKNNEGTFIKYIMEVFEKETKKTRDEINLIYKVDNKDYKKDEEYNIFGYVFAHNNKNNIDLIINGEKSQLVWKYKLKEGENNIKLIIKNQLTNLDSMFSGCNTLNDINELKYLNTNNVNNYSGMFEGCSSISDIKALENWNVFNGNDFSCMFYGCSSLTDIKPLENWKISRAWFKRMFDKKKDII